MILLKIDGRARPSLRHVTAPVVWNATANFLSDITMPSMNICILINWTKTEERDFFMQHSAFCSLFQMKREASPHCIFLDKKQRRGLINSRWPVSFCTQARCEASILPAFLRTPVYLITKISLWCGCSYLLRDAEGTLTHRISQILFPPIRKWKQGRSKMKRIHF